jgi:hypothetical protein
LYYRAAFCADGALVMRASQVETMWKHSGLSRRQRQLFPWPAKMRSEGEST